MNIVMLSRAIVLLCLVAVANSTATAQHTLPKSSGASTLYIENKGQIGDQHGKPNHDVRFLILRPGLNIQLRQNGFSYDSYTVDRCELPLDSTEPWMPTRFRDRPHEEVTYHFHRVDVDLVCAHPRPLITATGASQDYLNYYTHITQQVHGDKGATDVRGYARVTYHDVWPGVDMEWFIDDQQRPEYQFVVRPGGNVASIQLKYRGANSTELVADALTLHVQHGPIRETLPRSYVLGTGVNVDVRYRAAGANTYGFTVPPIDIAMGETIVIDPMPELVWATYYGGGSYDQANSVVVNARGEAVIAGYTDSESAIATEGSHQSNHELGNDGFVACLTSAGARLWGTYTGGPGTDQLTAVAVSVVGEIVAVGRTDSPTSIATVNSHQADLWGGPGGDAFVVQLNSSGLREWSTYYGGDKLDLAASVAFAANREIVVAGYTNSSAAIATAGSHQAVYGGGGDAFVVRLSNTGVRLLGTYYGGTGLDEALGVAVLADGTIVAVGRTSSTGGVATAASHQAGIGSTRDAFVVQLGSSGVRNWGTYYGGSADEFATAVAVTDIGNVVIAGWTQSANGIATAGSHQSEKAGNRDAFVAMFTAAGVRQWGSYYGGESIDEALAVAAIANGGVRIAGRTWSSSGISTLGSHQFDFGGGDYDGYVATLSTDGTHIWGTYLGGTSRDAVLSIAPTTSRNTIAVGLTESANAIASDARHQAVYASGVDAFIALIGQADSNTSNVSSDAIGMQNSIASLRPNPASNEVVVSTYSPTDGKLDVVDVLGRTVATIPVAGGSTETPIAIGQLPRGQYTIRLLPALGTTPPTTRMLVIVQ